MKNINLKLRPKHPFFANPGFLSCLLQVFAYHILLYLVFSLGSCKKPDPSLLDELTKTENEHLSISKEEAIRFIENRINTAKANPQDSANRFLISLTPNYHKLYHKTNSGSNAWNLSLDGPPIYHGQKMGYRKLLIFRDSISQRLTAEVNEVLPDPIALQSGAVITAQNFSGRIFRYDLSYKLKGGSILSLGKTTGEIRPGPAPAQNLLTLNTTNLKSSNPKYPIMLAIMESCSWSQDAYVDGMGSLTVHSYMVCSYAFYQESKWSISDDYGGGGYNSDEYGSGGGGTNAVQPIIPEPSNLPMEDAKPVNPKEMMDCFSLITTPNAAFTVRVLVLEPFVGTSFNLGPNSFGHVAIQLSKTGNGQTITQTMGLYPTGSGIDKLKSKGQILDNGDMKYELSATYPVTGETFGKLINYISGERKDYHFTDFNCASYVYQAGKAAGIPIPNPITPVGISGPGGAGFADTPAGMAAALREQKVKNPAMDLNQGGGTIGPSKGPCK